MPPVLRRLRGSVLRLARRRVLSVMVGLILLLPSVWIHWAGYVSAWWVEGLSLVVGATGAALVWTGLTGAAPDWVE